MWFDIGADINLLELHDKSLIQLKPQVFEPYYTYYEMI